MDAQPSQSDPSRRRSPARLGLAAVVVIAVVIVALLVPVPLTGRSATAICDLMHAPLFAGLTLGWLWGWQRVAPLGNQRVGWPLAIHLTARGATVWAGLSLFGWAMEYVQAQTGRSMSPHDAVANALGSGAAVAIYAGGWLFAASRRWAALPLAALALGLFGAAWFRPVTTLIDAAAMRQAFPKLASFERWAELTRWQFQHARPQRVAQHAADGQYALEVAFDSTRDSAVTLIDTVPDWTPFRRLEIDATLVETSGSGPVPLEVVVIDWPRREDDPEAGFVKRFRLAVGRRQRLRVPLAERHSGRHGDGVDLTRVAHLRFSLPGLSAPAVVRLDRLRLVP